MTEQTFYAFFYIILYLTVRIYCILKLLRDLKEAHVQKLTHCSFLALGDKPTVFKPAKFPQSEMEARKLRGFCFIKINLVLNL